MSSFGYSMPSYFKDMPHIGKPLSKVDADNEQQLKAIEQEIAKKIEEVLASGKSDEAINKSGQMTAMQRIHHLVDEGTWCPLDSLLNRMNNKNGSVGVIIGLGKIHDKWAVIIASDNKKLAGAWVPGQAEKLVRASDMAKQLNIPLVYVLNCSGVKLDEQEKVYAGRITGGTPFYRNAELQQMGIPVIVGIYGTNPAGGGYHSISPSVLIAHKDANMAVGGAGIVGGMNPKGYIDQEAAQALIDATKKAGKIDPPGSVAVHFGETGFFREVYDAEEGVIAAIQKYMDAMPAYDENFFRVDDPKEPVLNVNDLYSQIPLNPKKGYNSYEYLARFFDDSQFMEYKSDYGPEIITGLAKMNGLLCGVVTNRQGIIPNYPEYRRAEGAMGIGGKLYRQGLIKMNEFVTLCGRDRLPIVWIQDTTGIDVGDPAERAELLGLGQSLIYSIEQAHVPQMEITLRKGTAAAHYVMGGPQGTNNNVFSIGAATCEIYVMHGETAAAAMYARRLVKDQDSGVSLDETIAKMNKLIENYHRNSRPIFCAQVGLVDEVVDFANIRKYIGAFIGAAYQNPRSFCAFHHMMTPRIIRDHDEIYKK